MTTRAYTDRCPGVCRPWLAEDGAIVRLRIPGGRTTVSALLALVDIAERYGDGNVLLTKRANLQLRGLPIDEAALPDDLVAAIQATGLLPSTSHELVRNIMASPLTGLLGGRLDLRPVVDTLDHALLADPALADLGGRFLFVLDDGRGDVAGRDLDLGVMAVDKQRMQVRAGSQTWGPVVEIDHVAAVLADLARRFQQVRGDGLTASWHVDELPDAGKSVLIDPWLRDAATYAQSPPVPSGEYRADDGRRVTVLAVPDGIVTGPLAERLTAEGAGDLVVTPWRSLVMVER